MPSAPRFLDILRVLAAHEVEFLVVGGVAAILEGAPVATLDLDIMHERGEANRARLLPALQELHALYFDPAKRTIFPDALKLETLQLHRLVTDAGPLDILTEIAPGSTYEDLASETVVYEIEGLRVRVLTLAAVVRSKEHADRDKDRAVLPVLRRTLALKQSGGRE